MYAATFASKIFRIMMTLVADFHVKITQLDTVNVFLNVFNDEKIYCQLSNEYKQLKKILKSLRALYDQRKSSLLWLRILIDKCIELELNSIFDEFCLFSNDNEILMFFYVNDIVFAFIASREQDAENLIRRLNDIFDMRNLDSLNFFLDVRILQKFDTIWLILAWSQNWVSDMSNNSTRFNPRVEQEFLFNSRVWTKFFVQTREICMWRARFHRVRAIQPKGWADEFARPAGRVWTFVRNPILRPG